MDIEPTVLCEVQDAWRDQKAEGDGNDEVDGGWRCPTSEGVNSMGLEVEFVGGYLLDGNWR
jgi:hypothetical protein